MSKLFPEYKKFDLSEINKEINAFWKEHHIFENLLISAKVNPLLSLMKVLLRPTENRAFIM